MVRFWQCDVLDASVRNWCNRRVSTYCSKKLLYVATAESSEKDEATNSKDARHQFVLKISEAVGVDLWLDTHRLKGLVTDACLREAAQAKLDEQVSRYGLHAYVTTLLFVGIVVRLYY